MVLKDNDEIMQEEGYEMPRVRPQRKSKTFCEQFIGDYTHKKGKGVNPKDSPDE